MPLQSGAILGLVMRFDVEVDGIDIGGWASCEGLSVDFGLKEVREGGTNDHSYFLPDQMKYSKIKLVRAMTKADSARVAGWLSSCVDKQEGGTAKITLKDAHNEDVASWSLRNVLPASWKGPSLSADGHSAIATETLELVHEGFL
jgi:phage tail-like protein